VRDSGLGMSEETRKRAFEPFFTTKAAGHGTGLGLASCHGFVTQARGHIFVTSELGRGTEIRMYLPRAEGVAEQTQREPIQSVPRGRETVLIVEDHDLLRSLMVRTLTAQGYDVIAAASGVEAQEIAAGSGRGLDLLITDVVMPHMTGFALAAKLLVSHPNLPVLYVSGYSERNVMSEHPASSCADFLPKPFTSSALALKVRELLDRAASQPHAGPRLRIVS
jgi:two-component system cell cycle sensor histidine kinase/response regulator CckA